MAKKFWTFIGNDKYDIGLTGSTVYVYDKNGTELATFKDLTYAYNAVISPLGDIFVVKTTDGRMAIYSFEPLKLVKKFRFSKIDGGQDENMVFSPDGKYFYSIESHTNTSKTLLAKYKTDDFSLVCQLFSDRERFRLSAIEYDENTDCYYVLGILYSPETKMANTWFVAKLVDDELVDMRYITEGERDFGNAVNRLKVMGYTEKAFQWSAFRYKKEYDDRYKISLDEIKALNYSLATLWKNASTTPIEKKD